MSKPIRVDISDKISNDLNYIKDHLGLKNDSEAIRYCIRELARQIEDTPSLDRIEKLEFEVKLLMEQFSKSSDTERDLIRDRLISAAEQNEIKKKV